MYFHSIGDTYNKKKKRVGIFNSIIDHYRDICVTISMYALCCIDWTDLPTTLPSGEGGCVYIYNVFVWCLFLHEPHKNVGIGRLATSR